MRVRVREGVAVYDGERHRGEGDVLDVSPELAGRWLAAGWVEPIRQAEPKAPRKRTAT